MEKKVTTEIKVEITQKDIQEFLLNADIITKLCFVQLSLKNIPDKELQKMRSFFSQTLKIFTLELRLFIERCNFNNNETTREID